MPLLSRSRGRFFLPVCCSFFFLHFFNVCGLHRRLRASN